MAQALLGNDNEDVEVKVDASGNDSLDLLESSMAREEKRVDSLLTQLEENPCLTTLIDVFSGLLVNPNFRQFGETINLTKEKITDVFVVSDDLLKFAGKTEIDTLYAILSQFIELIHATRDTVENVRIQSRIQTNNLETF